MRCERDAQIAQLRSVIGAAQDIVDDPPRVIDIAKAARQIGALRSALAQIDAAALVRALDVAGDVEAERNSLRLRLAELEQKPKRARRRG